jgi:hypothetical protein
MEHGLEGYSPIFKANINIFEKNWKLKLNETFNHYYSPTLSAFDWIWTKEINNLSFPWTRFGSQNF